MQYFILKCIIFNFAIFTENYAEKKPYRKIISILTGEINTLITAFNFNQCPIMSEETE